MTDNNIDERLQRIEDTLEELVERQKETVELVQGHFEGLADTIRDAEEKIREATDDAVERLVDEPAYPSSLRNSVERIEETVESIEDSVDRLERADDTPDEGSREEGADVDEDAFYEKAREFVVGEQRASTSLLQRRFKIGYGRAARLMDMLERGGVIEPSDGTNRPRKVLEERGGDYEPVGLEDDDKDEHFDEAAAFVRAEGRISVAMIQRRVKVGYGRAARIMDQLEMAGVVEPSRGRSGPRKVVG